MSNTIIKQSCNSSEYSIGYCMVVSPAYLAGALACVQSLRLALDENRIHIDLLGEIEALPSDFEALNCEIISHDSFASGDSAKNKGYTPLEYAVSIKSIFLQYINSFYSYDYLVYLDADLYFKRSLNDYLINNCDLSQVLLTPHNLVGHIKADLINSRSGVFNTGLVGFPRHHELLNWWSDRCSDFCFLEPEDGLFVDQKWLDQAVALFDKVTVCRDGRLNVGYWNVEERQTILDDIICYHFSGLDIYSDGKRLSKYSDITISEAYYADVATYRGLVRRCNGTLKNLKVIVDLSASSHHIVQARVAHTAKDDGYFGLLGKRRGRNSLGVILAIFVRFLPNRLRGSYLHKVIGLFRRLGRHSTWYEES